jgi:hypothetical protein
MLDLTADWRPPACLIAVVAAVGAVRHNGDLRDDGRRPRVPCLTFFPRLRTDAFWWKCDAPVEGSLLRVHLTAQLVPACCLEFEMYEIGKGKGSERAKFGPC